MLSPQPASQRPASVVAAIRAPAEARLRLMLHPIRRTATLSAVLARPPAIPTASPFCSAMARRSAPTARTGMMTSTSSGRRTCFRERSGWIERGVSMASEHPVYPHLR